MVKTCPFTEPRPPRSTCQLCLSEAKRFFQRKAALGGLRPPRHDYLSFVNIAESLVVSPQIQQSGQSACGSVSFIASSRAGQLTQPQPPQSPDEFPKAMLFPRKTEHVLSAAREDLDHPEPSCLQGLLECDTALGESAHGTYGYREELYPASPQLKVALSEMYRLAAV